MQSSPPARRLQEPASPVESQYSLDLAALDLDSRSGASTPAAQQHVDKILSEDIDGPSDFTLNMEKWMRGGLHRDGRADAAANGNHSVENPSVPMRASRQLGPSPVSGAGPAKDDLVPGTDGAPHIAQMTVDEASDAAEDDNASNWDGDDAAPSLHPLHANHLLQPTVEDYHSELTPVRHESRLQSPIFSHGRPGSKTTHNEESMSNSESQSQPPSPLSSPAPSPIFHRQASRQFSSQTDEAAFESQISRLRELEAKCAQLERLNAALSRDVSEERKAREDERVTHEAWIEAATLREDSLAQRRDKAGLAVNELERQLSDAQRQNQALKEQRSEDQAATNAESGSVDLKVSKDQIQQQHNEALSNLQQKHDAEIEELERRLMEEKSNADEQIRAVERDLASARRVCDEAEKTAQNRREELERYQDQQETEMHGLKLRLQETDDLKATIADQKAQLQSLSIDKEEMASTQNAAETVMHNLRAELSILKQAHSEETTRLSKDHRRAVSLAEEMQVKMKELRQQMRDERATRDAEIELLQPQQSSGAAPSSAKQLVELKALRDELEARQSQLNNALIERDAAQDDLQSVQASLDSTRFRLEDSEKSRVNHQSDLDAVKIELTNLQAVNSAMDTKVSNAVSRREAYWRSRIEEIEKERKLMAKALLTQWGREEVGVDEKMQRYLYKYVTRRGAKGKDTVVDA